MKTPDHHQMGAPTMVKLFTAALFAACAACLTVPSAGHAAETDASEIPEHILAKMARYRTKRFGDEDSGGGSKFARDRSPVIGGCGGVNVGNVTAGRGGRLPREVTVVVTGDVINTNNKCD